MEENRNKVGYSQKQGTHIGTNRKKTGKIGTDQNRSEQIGVTPFLATPNPPNKKKENIAEK